MLYGLATFPTTYSMSPAELAQAAEDREFESLWVAEHSHIPACRSTPWPGGSELPQMYYDVYDPFVALTAAAAATSKIKLATGISLVVQRHPITLAKQVATLDCISNGRFLFGVGGGWNVEEIENHGTPFKRRFKLMRERVEAMKALWTLPTAEYHGEFVDFDPVHLNPKPLQKPHPPIHVGGEAPWAIGRAVAYGDGWMPLAGRTAGRDICDEIPEFLHAAKEAGRDPDSLEVSLYACPPDRQALERYREAGLSRAIFFVPSANAEVVLPLLDNYAGLASQVG